MGAVAGLPGQATPSVTLREGPPWAGGAPSSQAPAEYWTDSHSPGGSVSPVLPLLVPLLFLTGCL